MLLSDNCARLHLTLAPHRAPTPVTDFWEVLRSFENQSLWRYFHCDGDGRWIHRGLLMGSLVIVHDGSYMPEVEKGICSAGYMVYCKVTKQRAKGTVVEASSGADNYRGEVLGGLMVQLLLRAASQQRHSPYAPVAIKCDNMGVVKHGNAPSCALKEKQAQADVLRVLKLLIDDNPLTVEYEWVASHQDRHKRWAQLTLEEKINVIVDVLAKCALIAGIVERDFISSCFPFEHVRVKLGNRKVTGSPRKAIEDYWGERTARDFYHRKHIVNKHEFHLVWWEGCAQVMHAHPKMFRVYVTKNTSHFCGTNRQLSRIDPSVENVCPSCGCNDEPASHITRCQDEG